MRSTQTIIKRIVILICFSVLFLPDLYSQPYNISTCSGTTFSFQDPSLPNGTTYTWGAPIISPAISNASAQGNPQLSVSQTLTNTSSAVATATYTVTTSANTTFQLIVTVNPSPTLSSTLTPSAVCSNTTFSITPPVPQPAQLLTGAELLLPVSRIIWPRAMVISMKH